MSDPYFDARIQRYADVIIKVGINLQAGQRLLVRAPLEAAPLVRAVATSAYRSGCRLVTVLYIDEKETLIRFQEAPRDSFEEYPSWLSAGTLEHAKAGGAQISIVGEDPDLLKNQDPELIATVRKTAMKHNRELSLLVSKNYFNWLVVGYPTPNWAQKAFPDVDTETAIATLWDAIFQVCRIDQEDPVAAWEAHIENLVRIADYLNARQYSALKITAPGTDLTVGLAHNHIWEGGQAVTQSGVPYTPNLPTEEIFTAPHRARVDGVVRASKPLSYAGQLIEDFSLTFEDGKVIDFQAARGEALLKTLIETDDGSSRLGEVALVANSSPISQFGRLFYNTLFDENAACHLALGRAYRISIHEGDQMSDEAFAEQGGNDSLMHVDFMIGSAEMDVNGVAADGSSEPLMRQGEWVI